MLTSRGVREESWCTVKHLLHAEGHLEEEIANSSRSNPSLIPNLAKRLDHVRRQRQDQVKLLLSGTKLSFNTTKGCNRCSADLDRSRSRSFLKCVRRLKLRCKKKGVCLDPNVVCRNL